MQRLLKPNGLLAGEVLIAFRTHQRVFVRTGSKPCYASILVRAAHAVHIRVAQYCCHLDNTLQPPTRRPE